MQLLVSSFTDGQTSPIFRVDQYGETSSFTVYVNKASAAALGGTITMQFCPFPATSSTAQVFETFIWEGTSQTWTTAQSNFMRSYDFNVGGWFRFVAGVGVASANIYIGGPAVQPGG